MGRIPVTDDRAFDGFFIYEVSCIGIGDHSTKNYSSKILSVNEIPVMKLKSVFERICDVKVLSIKQVWLWQKNHTKETIDTITSMNYSVKKGDLFYGLEKLTLPFRKVKYEEMFEVLSELFGQMNIDWKLNSIKDY